MFKTNSFRGGTHPPEDKSRTEHLPIENVPIPEKILIPLQQHIGAPAEPVVEKGAGVKTGQVIAKSNGFISIPAHATCSGTVTAVDLFTHPLGNRMLAIEIENDGKDEWEQKQSRALSIRSLKKDEMLKRIQEAGIAGMGGAAFPTHVKLSPPEDKPVDIILLNGAECEPCLTADHRLMLEQPDLIIQGMRIMMKILGVKTGIIGIERNKPDAIDTITERVRKVKSIRVLPLKVKYPQGAEKQLIKAATGREVPCGGLPMDVGCLVHNVGTALAVAEAVSVKKPLIERIVTVTGNGIAKPKNCRVRIGTSFRHIIEFCGGYTANASKLISGGPMMGIAQVTDAVPVIKGTSGILVLDRKQAFLRKENPCIGCARCVDVCPMNLVPNRIAAFVEYQKIDKARRLGLIDCIECGSCSYICPAKRNLVHYIKLGKAVWNKTQKKAQ
ncbi:MAG TPA: electron transport complex subunit RsxC [bacterium]|nr:electron transport complex subunit RsxC [bacterium]